VKREAAVIGSPISHSRSPAIFRFLAERTGLADFEYDAREVKPDGLAEFLANARRSPALVGLNVTIPHKQAVCPALDEISSEARAIGAVNVVHAREGRLTGYNTDVIGIARTLADVGCDVRGEDCLLYGSGGAAKAVAYVLGLAGARGVFLLNRTRASSYALAERMGAIFPSTAFLSSSPGALPPALKLVVNSTPIGMRGIDPQPGFFDSLAELPFEKDALAFDLVYDPEETQFLRAARDRGLRVAGGLPMLVDQALATWELWFGALEGEPKLRGELLEKLRSLLSPLPGSRPVFLAGFMGVGKSSVAAALASRLGWRHVDSDRAVERQAGLSVREIFAKKGEAEFRRLERETVAALARSPRTVVSLGGGALLDPESLATIESSGDLVFLSAEVETLDERLARNADSRPLLAGLDASGRREKIRSMLLAREPIYRRARIQLATDGMTAERASEELVRRLSEARQ
jgi:shikimate dehydrogenase